MKITFGEKCQKMRVSIFYIYLLHNNKVVIQNSVYRFIWSFYIELVRSAPVSLFLFRRVIEWSLIIFSHYIARTNYFLIIWWWCLLCTRGTLGSHYFQNFTLKSREKEKSSRPVFTMCDEPCYLMIFPLHDLFNCKQLYLDTICHAVAHCQLPSWSGHECAVYAEYLHMKSW